MVSAWLGADDSERAAAYLLISRPLPSGVVQRRETIASGRPGAKTAKMSEHGPSISNSDRKSPNNEQVDSMSAC